MLDYILNINYNHLLIKDNYLYCNNILHDLNKNYDLMDLHELLMYKLILLSKIDGF